MRQQKPEMQLELAENFQNLMVEDDGNLPDHRRNYPCTEPGLFTNSDAAFPGSGEGSRIYFVDTDGQFLPHCSPDPTNKVDDGKIGCEHIAATVQAITIQDGAASSKSAVGESITFFWYDAPDPKRRRPISHDVLYAETQQRGRDGATEAASQLSEGIASAIAPAMDNATVSEIAARVVVEMTTFVTDRLAIQPLFRPMSSITVDPNAGPAITADQLRALTSQQKPSEWWKRKEAEILKDQAAGEPSAFAPAVVEEFERKLREGL